MFVFDCIFNYALCLLYPAQQLSANFVEVRYK